MKCQDLFSKKKNKKINLKVSSAAVVIGALRVKVFRYMVVTHITIHVRNLPRYKKFRYISAQSVGHLPTSDVGNTL